MSTTSSPCRTSTQRPSRISKTTTVEGLSGQALKPSLGLPNKNIWIEVSQKTIDDKSKADIFQKILVVMQVL